MDNFNVRNQLKHVKRADLRKHQTDRTIYLEIKALGLDMHKRADLLNGTNETGLLHIRRELAISMLALSDAIRMGALGH